MRRTLFCFTAAVFMTLIGAAAPAVAQDAEEAAVRDVVKRLFDGMRTRDTTMMKSVFHADAKMYGLGRDGTIQPMAPSQFVQVIAGAPPNLVLDEVLHEVEVRIDGALATVWAYYDFFAGERFSHCGYDAFQMLKAGGEWKVVAITDSRRTEGCKQKRGQAH